MPRGTRNPSEVFRSVLEAARRQVLLDGSKAGAFEHKGIRGDERAASLAQFFRERLPDRFGVGKGEVVDYQDRRTGQLDLIIYDRVSCAPISAQSENLLLPCEALYCVIEAKSKVTQDELDTSLAAAGRLRELRPFKAHFITTRRDGSSADDGQHRCLYIVFGYASNLANDAQWPEKEYRRLLTAATRANIAVDCLDRLIVIDRGMINPPTISGKWEAGSAESVFLESYLHIVNFLNRESARRKPVDWQMYGPRSAKGWKMLA